MAADWTLKVEDFGRIAEAEVTVKPLTVLVGRNNSGKSYLATLIWGMHFGWLRLWPQQPKIEHILKGWLQRAQEAVGQWVPWSESERQSLTSVILSLMDEQRLDLTRLCFDTADLHLGHLGFSRLDESHSCYIRCETFSDTTPFGSSGSPILLVANRQIAVRKSLSETFQHLAKVKGRGHLAISSVGVDNLASGLEAAMGIRGLGEPALGEPYKDGHAVFLPAARTGFSLFLPVFIKSSITNFRTQRASHESASKGGFTLPQLHLLQGLASAFGGERGPYADEADRLERECLEGVIETEADLGVTRYRFTPSGGDDSIELQLASALVTELMPLVITLRYAQRLPFVVLEEPEAHLHPRLQRTVVRCLARLVRRGVRVLITTHSATVAQQVNNLMKLDALDPEQRQRFGYDPDEHLTADDVAMHELVFRDDGRTVLESRRPTREGFGLPSLNEALIDFARETLDLNAILEPEPEESV